MYLVEISPSFISRVLSLNLLHHLLPKAADLGGALDGHVLGALVAAIINDDKLSDRAEQSRAVDNSKMHHNCWLPSDSNEADGHFLSL